MKLFQQNIFVKNFVAFFIMFPINACCETTVVAFETQFMDMDNAIC